MRILQSDLLKDPIFIGTSKYSGQTRWREISEEVEEAEVEIEIKTATPGHLKLKLIEKYSLKGEKSYYDIDHFVPKSLGGPGNLEQNLRPLGAGANRHKGNKVPKGLFITATNEKFQHIFPENLINIDGSDSSALDNMIQLLVEGGMNLFRAIRAVIPPAWQNIQILDPHIRAFHEYNSMHMEAWDGPAGIALANKRYAVSFLDRNGMRPLRYQIEKDGTVTVASETGVNPVSATKIEAKGRISPGGIFAVDKETGKILTETDIDQELASKYPYRDWLKEHSNYVESKLDQSEGSGLKKISPEKYTLATKIFSLFLEERTSVIKVLGAAAQEGTGSMGDDTALAVLSRQNRQIYDYFRQQFSQVTNPPIDSLREQSVMSLETCYGP